MRAHVYGVLETCIQIPSYYRMSFAASTPKFTKWFNCRHGKRFVTATLSKQSRRDSTRYRASCLRDFWALLASVRMYGMEIRPNISLVFGHSLDKQCDPVICKPARTNKTV